MSDEGRERPATLDAFLRGVEPGRRDAVRRLVAIGFVAPTIASFSMATLSLRDAPEHVIAAAPAIGVAEDWMRRVTGEHGRKRIEVGSPSAPRLGR